MSKCLVTTLKESVSDESLLKLGDFKMHILPTDTLMKKIINWGILGANITITLDGDGYFTDSSGTSNLGKTKAMNTDSYILPNIECNAIISSKYTLPGLDLREDTAATSNSAGGFVEFDLSDLDGCPLTGGLRIARFNHVTGDISRIGKRCESKLIIRNSPIGKGHLTGDIGSIEKDIPIIDLREQPGIYGNLSSMSEKTSLVILGLDSTKVEGDISSLSGLTSLEELDLKNTKVVGNLSSISGLTSMRILELSNTAITGDTSSVANLTNLISFIYTNTAITGNWPLT